MAKGYWIARVDVSDQDEYAKYIAASTVVFAKYGAIALARGGHATVMEGTGRRRNVVWEFPSLADALACYHCAQYQEAKALREPASVADVILIEGVAA